MRPHPPRVRLASRGPAGPTGPAGTTDHSLLTNLAADDHPQYHNDARALTWLATRDTDDLAEGATNLYFTNARADARIAAADHGVLQGLGDDDHTQYHTDARALTWLLARADDTDFDFAATQTMTKIITRDIRTNDTNTANLGTMYGRWQIVREADSTTAGNLLRMDMRALSPSAAFTYLRADTPLAMPGAAINLLQLTGEVTKTGVGVPFVLFPVTPTFKLQGAGASGQIFFFAPTYSDDGSVRTISGGTRAIILNPIYAALTPGSTGTPLNLVGIDSTPTVDSSWNPIPQQNYISMSAAAGSAAVAVTEANGILVASSMSKIGTVWTIQDLFDQGRMYHRGSIAVGGGATATAAATLLHLRDNAVEHTSITLDEETTDPAAPAANAEGRIYFKNGKLVVQWNDGTNTLYTTIPLASAGPYPVNPVVTTDTAAP